MKTPEKRPVLGRNIVRFRKAKYLSQAELAKLIGVERPLIALYETRQMDPPVSVVAKLAKALGVSIYDLIGESPEPQVENFSEIDPRTLRKTLEIAELSREDRAFIYGMIKKLHTISKNNSLVAENMIEKNKSGD